MLRKGYTEVSHYVSYLYSISYKILRGLPPSFTALALSLYFTGETQLLPLEAVEQH